MKIQIQSKTYELFYLNFQSGVISNQGLGLVSEVKNAGKFVGEINQNCFWITKESLLPQRIPKVKFHGEISEEKGISIKGHFKFDAISATIVVFFTAFIFGILFMTESPPRNVFHAIVGATFFDLCIIVTMYIFNIKRIYDIIKFLSSL